MSVDPAEDGLSAVLDPADPQALADAQAVADGAVVFAEAAAATSDGDEGVDNAAPVADATPVPVPRHARWQHYLADLEAYAAVRVPLASHGTLVRVTGLVMEAAGVRAPLGAVCEVQGDTGEPVLAEVVGFNGDRSFLMATGELHGLSSGARVTPRATPMAPPRLGRDNPLWRRREDRGLHLAMGDGLLGRVVDAHGVPMDRLGPLEHVRNAPMIRRPINAMDRDPVRHAAGHRRAGDQRACSPWAAASAWACSQAPAWARAC